MSSGEGNPAESGPTLEKKTEFDGTMEEAENVLNENSGDSTGMWLSGLPQNRKRELGFKVADHCLKKGLDKSLDALVKDRDIVQSRDTNGKRLMDHAWDLHGGQGMQGTLGHFLIWRSCSPKPTAY